MYWLHTLCKRHVSACINTISFTKSTGCLLLSKIWVQCNCATGAPKILASHHNYAEKLSNNPPTEWLCMRSRSTTAVSALCAVKWAAPQVWLTRALCSLLLTSDTRSIHSSSPGHLMTIAKVASLQPWDVSEECTYCLQHLPERNSPFLLETLTASSRKATKTL